MAKSMAPKSIRFRSENEKGGGGGVVEVVESIFDTPALCAHSAFKLLVNLLLFVFFDCTFQII